MRSACCAALIVAACAATMGPWRAVSHAEPSAPPVEERRESPFTANVDREYDRGVQARLAKQWAAAVEAFQAAVTLRPNFPEAWNELGYALRNQGRYPESLAAYEEALRQRPDFPEALEYLGEAYVKMGRLDEARRVLLRLRPLDSARAEELAEAIKRER